VHFLTYISKSKANLTYFFTEQVASIALPYTAPKGDPTIVHPLEHLNLNVECMAPNFSIGNYTIYIVDKS
jgi:hypothetical protein